MGWDGILPWLKQPPVSVTYIPYPIFHISHFMSPCLHVSMPTTHIHTHTHEKVMLPSPGFSLDLLLHPSLWRLSFFGLKSVTNARALNRCTRPARDHCPPHRLDTVTVAQRKSPLHARHHVPASVTPASTIPAAASNMYMYICIYVLLLLFLFFSFLGNILVAMPGPMANHVVGRHGSQALHVVLRAPYSSVLANSLLRIR
ncbi:hypothetical protein V8C37DRAFT_258555 [Trichoderma ceciliae]